jgi:mono/diheme cytochrome c family protein
LPGGAVRYVSYAELTHLPQVEYAVSEDTNLPENTRISGVPLDVLGTALGTAANADMIVAICYDKYRTNYPQSYLTDHRPLLVLKINDDPPWKWQSDKSGRALGPYLISNPDFSASTTNIARIEEKQIPFGVVRIEFRSEAEVFGAIRPRGSYPENSPVMQGYRIARQNCFRCHNVGSEGGHMAGRPWRTLAVWAAADPDRFNSYVRNPQLFNPHNRMEGSPQYNDATLSALRAYFSTFVTDTYK